MHVKNNAESVKKIDKNNIFFLTARYPILSSDGIQIFRRIVGRDETCPTYTIKRSILFVLRESEIVDIDNAFLIGRYPVLEDDDKFRKVRVIGNTLKILQRNYYILPLVGYVRNIITADLLCRVLQLNFEYCGIADLRIALHSECDIVILGSIQILKEHPESVISRVLGLDAVLELHPEALRAVPVNAVKGFRAALRKICRIFRPCSEVTAYIVRLLPGIKIGYHKLAAALAAGLSSSIRCRQRQRANHSY